MQRFQHRSRLAPTIRFTVAAIFVVTIVAATTQARSIYFTVDGGYTVQSGPDSFKRVWNNGYGGSVGAVFDAGSSIALRGRIEYQQFPMDRAADSIYLGSIRAVMVSLSTRFAFMDDDDPYRPFLELGYGTVDLSLSTDSKTRAVLTEYDTSELRGFLQIGAGLEMGLREGLKLEVEARYINIQSRYGGPSTSYFPLTIGLRF